MRHQYHSRKTPEGCDIWDVDRLVELTQGLEPVDVLLSDIGELDEPYWFEAEGSLPPTCRNIVTHFKLVQDCDLAYPVILCSEGCVMDGMHRICKALLEGRETIKAYRFKETPPPDYQNMSLSELPYRG